MYYCIHSGIDCMYCSMTLPDVCMYVRMYIHTYVRTYVSNLIVVWALSQGLLGLLQVPAELAALLTSTVCSLQLESCKLFAITDLREEGGRGKPTEYTDWAHPCVRTYVYSCTCICMFVCSWSMSVSAQDLIKQIIISIIIVYGQHAFCLHYTQPKFPRWHFLWRRFHKNTNRAQKSHTFFV